MQCFRKEVLDHINSETLHLLLPYLQQCISRPFWHTEMMDFMDLQISNELIMQKIQNYEDSDKSKDDIRKFFVFLRHYFVPESTYRIQVFEELLRSINIKCEERFLDWNKVDSDKQIQPITQLQTLQGVAVNDIFKIPPHTELLLAYSVKDNVRRFNEILQVKATQEEFDDIKVQWKKKAVSVLQKVDVSPKKEVQ